MKAKTLEKTCSSRPAQWVGFGDGGQRIYVRYRWGGLSVDIDGRQELYIDHGHQYDGEMTTADMMSLTGGVVDWSEIRDAETR